MASSQSSEAGGGIGFMFRALRHRNYALFFGGQMVSMVGTWMTRIAMSWLVYKLTGSGLLLGIVGFAGQIPSFVLAPNAGVLIDRWDRRRVQLVTQVLAMLQSGALAVLVLAGSIEVWHVIALALFQGFINSFDMPARQAFVVEMVTDRNDLPNAIALNSTLFNASRLIGPSVGGALIAAVGEGWCFAIDSISYIGVIGSLLAMSIAPRAIAETSKLNIREQLREGFAYVAGSPPIRSILLLIALTSLVGFPYTVLLPIYANEILAGGPNLLGFLMAASGVGAIVGAFVLANRRSVLGLGRFIPMATGLFGVSLVAFALSRSVWLSLPLLIAIGLGLMLQTAVSNTLIQTIVDEDKRGRVMSFYTVAFMGVAPFGSLLAGSLADVIGAPYTLVIGGTLCVAAAVVFHLELPRLRQFVRPIYIEKGILPELGSGVMQASQMGQGPNR